MTIEQLEAAFKSINSIEPNYHDFIYNESHYLKL